MAVAKVTEAVFAVRDATTAGNLPTSVVAATDGNRLEAIAAAMKAAIDLLSAGELASAILIARTEPELLLAALAWEHVPRLVIDLVAARFVTAGSMAAINALRAMAACEAACSGGETAPGAMRRAFGKEGVVLVADVRHPIRFFDVHAVLREELTPAERRRFFGGDGGGGGGGWRRLEASEYTSLAYRIGAALTRKGNALFAHSQGAFFGAAAGALARRLWTGEGALGESGDALEAVAALGEAAAEAGGARGIATLRLDAAAVYSAAQEGDKVAAGLLAKRVYRNL